MKKTLRLALLTAVISAFSVGGVKAQTTLLSWQFDGSMTIGTAEAAKGGTVTPAGETSDKLKTESAAYVDGVADDMKGTSKSGIKLGGNAAYLKVGLTANKFQAGDIIYICGYSPVMISTSTARKGEISTSVTLGDSKTAYKVGSATIPNDFTATDAIYINRVSASAGIVAIKVVRPDANAPQLTATPISLDLNATAEVNPVKATFTLTGKNLADGTYNLTIPSVAGLSVTPTSFTISDGTVNQEFTVSYTSEENVDLASDTIKTSVSDINIAVAVNYSAIVKEATQQSVEKATTWDFSKAADDLKKDVKGSTSEYTLFANAINGINNAIFDGDAILGKGNYLYRAQNKCFQGGGLKFNTTVAGTVEVTYSNTGGNPSRVVSVNGVNDTNGSASNKTKKTFKTSVTAGDVEILGVQESDGSYKDVRVYTLTFTPSAATTETATIGAAGYATYVTKGDVDFSGETALKAFAAKFDETAQTIKLTAVNAAPANTPLVLKGAAGDYTLTAAATTPATVADNELQSASAAVTADGSQWILAKLNGGVGFAKCTPNTTIAAGKAYLVIHATATAKSFIGFDDDTTNGIASVISEEASMKNARVYNLAGQQVTKAYKGVVIVNGKKYIQK